MSLGAYPDSVVLYDAHKRKWLLFHRPITVYATQHLEEVVALLREIEHRVAAEGLHAAGFIAYEAGPAFDPALAVRSPEAFPLLWFGVYQEPQVVAFPPLPREALPALSWQPSVTEDEYRKAFHRIKEYIRAGDTYQVNYTFRLSASFSEDPWKLFVQMITAQGYGYGAFVNTERWTVCSASPELFFALEAGTLSSRPMKGTAARGLLLRDDRQQAAWLARSEKNRAENVMIVDMVRNDMGRIATRGSVRVPTLFEIEKYPTLWQMTSTVDCQTQASLTDILRALFPAASITGAPKVRTMQIVAELESAPRKTYTGTIGFLSPGPEAQFNVTIRTVLVDRLKETAEYGVGGGIVWDSENRDELQECFTKARILVQPPLAFSLLETLLWVPQDGYFLLDYHLARLAESAAYFSRSLDLAAIRRNLAELARTLPSSPHRVRLLVSQDHGATTEATILKPLPQPYRVQLARQSINAKDPFLYHKTTHRRVYEHALVEAPGYDDVLLWNEEHEVTESCIANVAVEREGRLLTPPVSCGLLPGTYRRHLLEQGEMEEGIITVADLQRESRIYLINSVRGKWEIALDQPRQSESNQDSDPAYPDRPRMERRLQRREGGRHYDEDCPFAD